MSDELSLLLAVLTALYLLDTLAWARRGALGLRALHGARFRAVLPSQLAGNTRGGALWANPLPPLGTLFVADSFPLTLSPQAFCTREPQEFERGPRELFLRRVRRWRDATSIEVRGKTLNVDGAVFARCDTERGAAVLAELLIELRAMSEAQRAQALERTLAAAFDSNRARELHTRFQAATRTLRRACNAYLVFLVAAAPLAYATLGLERTWIPLFVVLLGFQTTIGVLVSRAHHALFPCELPARVQALAIVSLSPPQAVRALDMLARPLFAGLQPFAAACLLPAPERELAARAAWIDLEHPRLNSRDENVEADACDAWFRERAALAFNAELQREGLQLAHIAAPPAAEEPTRTSYCPRCRAQFDAPEGVCFDCDVAHTPLKNR